MFKNLRALEYKAWNVPSPKESPWKDFAHLCRIMVWGKHTCLPLVGKLCLAWRGAEGGVWGLFEFLYGNVWLLSETALNVKEHPPQRDSPGGRPMKDGLAAARHGTNVTVKGQHGEHAVCGRTFLAPHASSTFHAAHSPPWDLHQQPLQTWARTLSNPTGKRGLCRWSHLTALTLTVLRVFACRHSIHVQRKESKEMVRWQIKTVFQKSGWGKHDALHHRDFFCSSSSIST